MCVHLCTHTCMREKRERDTHYIHVMHTSTNMYAYMHVHVLHTHRFIFICGWASHILDFPGGSDGKASAYNAGDPGSIHGLGRSSGEGNGNPLKYSCLEKYHGWRSMVGSSPWGCKSRTQLSNFILLSHVCAFNFIYLSIEFIVILL